jgi:hypothetical protein
MNVSVRSDHCIVTEVECPPDETDEECPMEEVEIKADKLDELKEFINEPVKWTFQRLDEKYFEKNSMHHSILTRYVKNGDSISLDICEISLEKYFENFINCVQHLNLKKISIELDELNVLRKDMLTILAKKTNAKIYYDINRIKHKFTPTD